MLLDENRNCNCGMNNTNSLAPSAVADSSTCGVDEGTVLAVDSQKISSDSARRVNCEARRDMMEQIRCLEFAVTELALYLDTHPTDEKALCLHRKYCKEYRELTDNYQKVYGPLTIQFPCNKWRWLEEPWPWEGGNI